MKTKLVLELGGYRRAGIKFMVDHHGLDKDAYDNLGAGCGASLTT